LALKPGLKPCRHKIYTRQKPKDKIMKTKNTIVLALIALGTSALLASAQDNNNDGPPGGDQRGPGQHRPAMDGSGQHGPGMGGPGGMNGHRPPLPAIIKALDANHDGVIDADEIANASAALKTLDKNSDGKLTVEEFMGPRPQRPQGERPQGRGGDNGGDNGAGGPPEGTPPPPQE
jgi:hypothetical protein